MFRVNTRPQKNYFNSFNWFGNVVAMILMRWNNNSTYSILCIKGYCLHQSSSCFSDGKCMTVASNCCCSVLVICVINLLEGKHIYYLFGQQQTHTFRNSASLKQLDVECFQPYPRELLPIITMWSHYHLYTIKPFLEFSTM